MSWIRVTERLPDSGVIVLACYRNAAGTWRRIRACWVAAKTSESSDYNDWAEYDDETDAYYDPEGWYEAIDNWDDMTRCFVREGTVTHWMPLPHPPKII